jgi:hypothetical protein
MSPPFIFLLAAFLARYLEFVAGNEPPVTVSTCVDLALARGDSPEGWTVVKNKFCEQKISRLVCVSGVNYFNLVSYSSSACLRDLISHIRITTETTIAVIHQGMSLGKTNLQDLVGWVSEQCLQLLTRNPE